MSVIAICINHALTRGPALLLCPRVAVGLEYVNCDDVPTLATNSMKTDFTVRLPFGAHKSQVHADAHDWVESSSTPQRSTVYSTTDAYGTRGINAQ